MHELARSLHYAGRGLARTPAFTVTVVLTLALAIGANSAVFSIFDRVLLRRLPFPEPGQLVYVTHFNETSALQTGIAPIRALDWSERSSSFVALAAYFAGDVTDTTGERAELVRRATVAQGFIDVWGIEPALGRDFTAEEHRLGGAAGILVSDRYWRGRLGARADVLGETLLIDGQRLTVVGVMPPELALVDADVDLWSPLLVDTPLTSSRQIGWFGGVVGRLRPGVSLDQAELDLRTVQAALAREYPETDADLTITAVPYRDTVGAPFRGSLWLLFGAVSILALIACANIAALLLARAAQRERDIAIRASLGASRLRIAAHLLVETTLLVSAGTAGGLLLAYSVLPVLQTYADDLPTFGAIALDTRVLAYTLVCAVVIAFLCGLFPALRGANSVRALSRTGRGDVSSRQTLSWALVGAQVAMSMTLLAAAGLLLRSFDSLSRVDAGFEAGRVLTFTIHGSFRENNDPAGVLARINRTIDELDALPGVEAAATSNRAPGTLFSVEDTYAFVDWTPPRDVPVVAETLWVSPSYFDALRIPLLSGELCRRPSSPADSRQVMVNRAFVDRYFGTTPVVGHRFAGESPSPIVGVVGNARELGMHRAAPPAVYFCESAPSPVPVFFVRTAGNPLDLIDSIRARLTELEPLRPIYELAPLARRISDVYAQDRLRTALLTLFSAAALSLAGLGVYGTLSYVVSLRRREVGLRVALGAPQKTIVTHYLAKAVKVVGTACLAGLLLSALLARFLSSMLYGISPSDPVTLATVIAIVLLVSMAAALAPALRAARIDPMTALRTD